MHAAELARRIREQLAAGDPAGACALLPALESVPDLAALPAAQACWADGRYDAALALFARAARAAPHDPDAALREVQALLMLDRRSQAQDRAQAAADRGAGSAPLALLAAQLRLDHEPARAVLPDLAALHAHAPGFGEAEVAALSLGILLGELPAQPRSFGRAMADARWQSALFQRTHIPPARLFGTAPAVLAAAQTACSVAGFVLEFGVYHGRSIRALAPGQDGLVHGFDSFEGLPADWTARDVRGGLSTGGRLPPVPDHVRLYPGWFEHSLPPFLHAHHDALRLAHIDCDLYASTCTVLDALAPRLVPGSVLVFDDFLAYPGYEGHEFRAWHEFAQRRRIAYEFLAFALLGREAALVLR